MGKEGKSKMKNLEGVVVHALLLKKCLGFSEPRVQSRHTPTHRNQSCQTAQDGASPNGARKGLLGILRSILSVWMWSGATGAPGFLLAHLETPESTSGRRSRGTSQVDPRQDS